MKIRNGFVSNSSSSSFIINTTQHPEYTEEKIKEVIKKIIDTNTELLGLDNYDVDKLEFLYYEDRIVFSDRHGEVIPSCLYELIERLLPGHWN